MDREKVIKGLECCSRTISKPLEDLCNSCPYNMDEDSTCITILTTDALELLKDRTKDYIEWSKQVGVHTCATCRRRDYDCQIENDYVLPMDGFCHLWWNGRPTE